MRTNEQRIAALHSRAAQLHKENMLRRTRLIGAAGATLCLGAALLPALRFAGLAVLPGALNAEAALSASLFAECPTLHFLAIAIVAFLLGAVATVFCFHLRAWHNRQEEAETRQSEEIQ